MSQINDLLESRLRNVRQDVRFRPIIDQVKAANEQGTRDSDALLAVAVRASVDSFRREGKAPDAYDVRERAFIAAAAAATERPMSLSDLPQGDDKTKHFFVSGLISLKVAELADWLLPKRWAAGVGVGVSVGLGWLKEVYDHFFATGYSRDDLKADVAGAKRPFTMNVPKAAAR